MLERAAVALSHAGRGGLPWLGLALAVGRGRRDIAASDGRRISLAAIAGAHVTSIGLSRIIGRTRPCEHERDALIPCPSGPSFPSDQAASAFAGATVLGWLEPRAHGLLLAGAAAVAGARVVAGVHYPADVAAGAALGVAVGRLAQRELEARVGSAAAAS